MSSNRPIGSGFQLALIVFATMAIIACADPPKRGPYLQNPSSTSMVIKWRNIESETGRVSYGTVPGALNRFVERKSVSIDHEILLKKLVPNTQYYYRVNGVADKEFTFTTPPVEGIAQPTRIWILGDAGRADLKARSVKESFYNFNGSSTTDLVVMLGDNAYKSGTDKEYQEAFFDMFAPTISSTPVMPVIGNHDVIADGGATYFDIFTLPVDGKTGGVPSSTEAYYSFNYSNIHFVALDSEISNRSTAGAMYNWLIADLAANDQDWTVVYFHHPPYSRGTHNSDSGSSAMTDMRRNYTPVFEQYGVDLVFSGHSHNYERSFPILGHQGKSDTFRESMKTDSGNGRKDDDGEYRKLYNSNDYGVIYTVAGNSGRTRAAPLNHPAHYLSMTELGSVVLDFDGDTVDVTFVSPNPGATDYYTITKSVL
jgi:predicted MPP superfamily phosphohydrolase